MDSLQQSILDFVRLNEPVSVDRIVRELKIYRNKFYALIEPLRMDGFLFSRSGFGIFYSVESYEAWLENGGREILSQRGRLGAEAWLEARKNKPWVAREGSVKFAILDCLKSATEPLGLPVISARTKINAKSISGALSYLIRIGSIVHDGKDFKRKYSLAEKVSEHEIVAEKAKPKPGNFKLYNPKKNGVVQAYLNSPARQRLMAVYGRMG